MNAPIAPFSLSTSWETWTEGHAKHPQYPTWCHGCQWIFNVHPQWGNHCPRCQAHTKPVIEFRYIGETPNLTIEARIPPAWAEQWARQTNP